MKTVSYTYAKAPTITCERLQAMQTLLATSTVDEDAALALLRRWLDGLDLADTPEGDEFRGAVAKFSQVVITLAEPAPPPEPPAVVQIARTASDLTLAVRAMRSAAAIGEDGVRLRAFADDLEKLLAASTEVASASLAVGVLK
jgi:hypothetical protein